MGHWLSDRSFHWSVRNQLIYPSCWEDPRVDRAALRIGPEDTVLVITSGGCNALDYALDRPQHIFAVDLNFRQNALLELKLAGIHHLEFDDFFDLFGYGYSDTAQRLYRSAMRCRLSDAARDFWDRNIRLFTNARRPFYLHGGIGRGMWLFKIYVDRIAKMRPVLDRLFAATTVNEQVQIYHDEVRPRFWTVPTRRMLNSTVFLSFAGIPPAQRQHARKSVPDVAEHMDRCAADVLGTTPLADNYFWQLYVHGKFTPDCCPEYLKPDNFARLKAGLAESISIHTETVADFLRQQRGSISRFALLDHFDWFYGDPAPLGDAWQAIVDSARPGARLVWRSMGTDTEFMHDCLVRYRGQDSQVGELLTYDRNLAATLKQQERANAYAGLFVAELQGR